MTPALRPRDQPPGYWTVGLLLLVPLVFGGLVVSDPYLSTFVPEEIFSAVALYNFPYKLTLATVALALLLGVLIASAAHAQEYRQVLVVVLISSMQMIALSAGGISLLNVLVILLLGLFLARALADPNQTLVVSGAMYLALALVLLDLPYLSVDNPVHFVASLLKFLRSVSLAFLIVNLLRDERLIRTAVQALLVVGFISACIGIAQVALYALTGVPYVIVPDLEQALKPTPFGFMLRAHGLNSEPHALSAFLLVALPFALQRVSTSRGVRAIAGSTTVVLVILLGICLTWSYGAILAAGLIVGLLPFCLWPRKALHIALLLLLIPPLLYFLDVSNNIYHMFRSDYSVSTGIFQRRGLAKVALEELSRNPWVGRGLNTMENASGNYWHWPPHNAFLQSWSYLGPLGFIIFAIVMIATTTRTILLGFRDDGPSGIRFRMLSLALLGLMLTMLSEPHFNSPTTWFVIGFAEAAIFVRYAELRAPRPNRTP